MNRSDTAETGSPSLGFTRVSEQPDCIDEKDNYGMSAFLHAVSMDAFDTVKILVENNTDIFATDYRGQTAVFIAAKFKAIIVLMYLLEIYRARKDKEGAFNPEMVDQLNCDQDTPMHLVCHNGYMEVATLLHEHGARLDTLDKDKRTSLHRAAAEGQTLVGKQTCGFWRYWC
ncbi:hypothetical protein Y032_0779g2294 [Ancylostoma ceylanicum]|uniref:Uncharacterized protein n=1 Tax=Ancylostoma ceylanicum TaxID=53326 RepID=A0A016WDC1_9BILA|nr:hypothetical protein Y032_0779g2294 [Ancylostoma ceylanicum]